MTTITDKLAEERGSALIELLVAIPAALAVFGAAAGLSGVFGNSQKVTQDRSDAIAERQVGTERMTRELRQAKQATIVSPTELRFTTSRVNGTVRYVCTGGACNRSVIRPDNTETTPVTIVKGVRSASFTGEPQDAAHPAFVSIRLDVEGTEEANIQVDDGVALANAS